MAINKIKSGDEVIVIAGRSKGRTGKVIKRVGADRLLVEGVNMVKKHQKPNPQKQIQGGIVEREATIHVSNVAILNTATNTADRVGIKTLEDGRKVRVYKSNNEVIDA